ncbi:MAG: class I SAM-dependent methyltransferase [Acidobacteria bacterium]|nr:class I SAM-dependent methyltransferase [Acidobacteriota bacterium]
MSREKELAYRYDLLISSDWRDRFDSFLEEHFVLPSEGRILEVNCGTGEFAIEMAERMRGKGEVIAIDADAERLHLARAKALVKKQEDVSFETGDTTALRFPNNDFTLVIGDASMLPREQIERTLQEMLRVAESEAPVILKLTTHGSFDEFFSIYWEALLNAGLADELLSQLEGLIHARFSVAEAEAIAKRAGLRQVVSFISKEEFEYETAKSFLESPLIEDIFLDTWMAIVPTAKRQQVRDEIIAIIDRERHQGSFEVSIKATLIRGIK